MVTHIKNPEKVLFSKEITAYKLGITVDQLSKYRKKGLIVAVKYKNTYRYTITAIENFIKENKN